MPTPLLRFWTGLPLAAVVAGMVVGMPPEVRASDGTAHHTAHHGARPVPSDSLNEPEAVVSAYLEAFQRTEWTTCADLMHPEALQSLKDVILETVRSDSSSGIPDALYGDGTPPETIRFAPPAELYARMLGAVYDASPGASTVLEGFSASVIGHVREGDAQVHVVVRTNVAPNGRDRVVGLSQVEVMSVQRHADTWRLRLTPDVQDVARAVRRSSP